MTAATINPRINTNKLCSSLCLPKACADKPVVDIRKKPQSHVMKVMEILHHHQMAVGRVSLSTHDGENGRIVRVANISNMPLPELVIAQIVHFTPKATVAVKRGENAGRAITSTNIVTNIQAFGKWDGKGEIEFRLPNPVAPEGQSAAILLQATRMGDYPGEIVAAIALD